MMTNEDTILYFQSLIRNYDDLVKDLNVEIISCKHEQERLKSELEVVISENKELSRELQNSLSPETKYSNLNIDSPELLNNLRQQINTLLNEKECVTKLWQDSVKTIDFLEDELKVFQAGTQEFVPKKDVHKLKFSYEEKINNLEVALTTTQKQLNEAERQAAMKLEVKHSEIDQSLENQASAFKIVKNLEAEVLKLQKRLMETVDEKNRVDRNLEQKDEMIQSLKRKNTEFWAKVTEAVNVVEAALNEKDAALFREKEIKEENEKLVQKMTDIVKESEEKIKRETTIIKNEYYEKEKKIIEELKTAQNDIQMKTLEIEALSKKSVLMENEIEKLQRIQTGVEVTDINKLLILEKNLESTFQKLLLSEKQNIQLISEKESIKNDLDQMANIYERNLRGKDIEISTLQSKITRLETELTESQEQINVTTEKFARLQERMITTEKELKIQKEDLVVGLKSHHESIVEELKKKYNDNIKDLKAQIDKKNEIHQKWKKEMNIINENLEMIVSNLKQEVEQLKMENKKMKEKLRKSEEKLKQYKKFLDLISKDVNKISTMAVTNNSVR